MPRTGPRLSWQALITYSCLLTSIDVGSGSSVDHACGGVGGVLASPTTMVKECWVMPPWYYHPVIRFRNFYTISLLIVICFSSGRVAFEKLTNFDFQGTTYYTIQNLSLWECQGWCREEPECAAAFLQVLALPHKNSTLADIRNLSNCHTCIQLLVYFRYFRYIVVYFPFYLVLKRVINVCMLLSITLHN